MRQVRRSAALTLLLLLAVTFGPLLCRTGGEQVWPAGRSVETALTVHSGQLPDAGAPLVVADTPKKCSGRHAPGPNESVPLPSPQRGEPLAPAATGPAPLATDAAAQCALARPPTGSSPTTEHSSLRPVLRI
ncbi:hypothetical protein [Streptomyces halobius]|uniref:Secreted protein n=1 Tax=Streptomyces halobius TaxID=2879846 RepID=A0ABY4M9D3_9ACTN|nr:hypothetical protein [Streptomyces halobius]UQA93010.1 hypothetical protein K9S39_15225 [Streptomyces halobius]